MTLRFLIADCEPAPGRDQRRASVGASSGEGYADVLRALVPAATVDIATPADADSRTWDAESLRSFDGVVLTGSTLHLYEPSPAERREVGFMRAVFASGTPSFGSCAGLQVATVAAGGTVRAMRNRREAGFGRHIWPTDEGRAHPLLHGRPLAYAAPTVHGDEVERLPPDATLLAGNAAAAIQAAEIRHDGGVFWGVQYHPELSLHEVATALRRDTDTLIEEGLARTPADVAAHADLIDALHHEPDRADLAWRLGVDAQVTNEALRRTELRNFIEYLVRPTRAGRRARD